MAESPSELRIEIEKLERKHAENPEGRYFVPLANAYRKLGAVEHAESLLRDGLRKHPEYLSAHIVLGRCLADRHASQEAFDEFRYVLSLDPQNLIALRTLAEISLAEGRREDAASWYQQLLAVDPMNEEARRSLEDLGAVAAPARPGSRPGDLWEAPPPPLRESAAPAADADGWRSEGADGSAGPDGRDEPYYGEFGAVDLDGVGGTDDDDAVEEIPGEVVTETIAELYARQGFYARSAEVLRELIRRRGGDAALEKRLAEVERLAASGGEGEDPVRHEVESAAEREPEPAEPVGGMDPLELQEGFGLSAPEVAPAAHMDDALPAVPDAEPEEEPAAEPQVAWGAEMEPAAGPTPSWEEFSVPEEVEPDPEPAPEAHAGPDAGGAGVGADEDAFAASFSHGFSGAEETISNYLSSLAAWRPRRSVPANAEAVAEAGIEGAGSPPVTHHGDPDVLEAEPLDSAVAAAEGRVEEAAEPVEAPLAEEAQPWDFAPAPEEPLEADAEQALEHTREREEEAEPLPGLLETDLPDRSREGAGTGSASDELFPWEMPPGLAQHDAGPPSGSEEAQTPARDDLVSFEDYLGSGGAEGAAEEAPEEREQPSPLVRDEAWEESGYEPLPPPEAASGPTEEAPAAPPPAPAAEAAGEAADEGEDDDLESFQAWLRSLKR